MTVLGQYVACADSRSVCRWTTPTAPPMQPPWRKTDQGPAGRHHTRSSLAQPCSRALSYASCTLLPLESSWTHMTVIVMQTCDLQKSCQHADADTCCRVIG